MHYGPYAFSKNGRRTIDVLKKEGKGKIGNRNNFSDKDVKKINILYNCPKTNPTPSSKPTTQSPPCRDTRSSVVCVTLNNLLGMCARSQRFQQSCRSTCDLCEEPCRNDDKNCEEWADPTKNNARVNYCTSSNSRYKRYMQQNCAKACGFC